MTAIATVPLVPPTSAVATVSISFNNSEVVWIASGESGEKRWFYVNNPDKIAIVVCRNIPPGMRIVADLVRNVGIPSGRAQSDDDVIYGIEVQSTFISGSEDNVLKLRREGRVFSQRSNRAQDRGIFYPFQIRLAVLKKRSDSEDYALVEAMFSRFFFMSSRRSAAHPEDIDWISLRDCERRFAGIFRPASSFNQASSIRMDYPGPRMQYHLTFAESVALNVHQDITVDATIAGVSAAFKRIKSMIKSLCARPTLSRTAEGSMDSDMPAIIPTDIRTSAEDTSALSTTDLTTSAADVLITTDLANSVALEDVVPTAETGGLHLGPFPWDSPSQALEPGFESEFSAYIQHLPPTPQTSDGPLAVDLQNVASDISSQGTSTQQPTDNLAVHISRSEL
ncbi:hypothetical protein HK405_005383 [Cladochytrium tenue]|nr:hypothetical protein HK405_005383 [Cladochytrium tenue]